MRFHLIDRPDKELRRHLSRAAGFGLGATAQALAWPRAGRFAATASPRG